MKRNKKRILFIIYSLKTGGAERVSLLWYSFLSKNGYDVKIANFTSHSVELFKDINIINLNIPATNKLILKPVILFKRIIKLKNLIKKWRPDYLISFMESSNFPALMTFHPKTIVSVHTFISRGLKRLNTLIRIAYRILIQFLYRFAYNIIVVSDGIKDDLIKNFKVKREKIKVIYNPIDIDLIRKKYNEKIEESYLRKKRYILNVGRLVKEKGQIYLIEAYKKLPEYLKKRYNLVIIGDGYLKEYLMKYINENNLDNRVFLLGTKDNPYKYFKQAELFVLSSEIEGFGIVIVESLALGVPVISFNIKSGPKEILCNGKEIRRQDGILLCKYGVLVECLNSNYLSDAICFLLENKKLLSKYRKLSLFRAKDFSIEKIGNRLIELLK